MHTVAVQIILEDIWGAYCEKICLLGCDALRHMQKNFTSKLIFCYESLM
jgi:hypothetical protein